MTDRILLTDDRLIISQPGHNASSSLSDANKVFDSEWAFGGAIIAAGYSEVPETFGSGYHNIFFPTQDYTPAAIVYDAAPVGAYVGSSTTPESDMVCFGLFDVSLYPKGEPDDTFHQYPLIGTGNIAIPYLLPLADYTYRRRPAFSKTLGGSRYRGFLYVVFAI